MDISEDLDKQIRDQIAAMITTAAPLAVVFPRWILKGVDVGKWPGLLKSELDGGRTHGYVITRIRQRGSFVAPGRRRLAWTYKFFGLYAYSTGNSESNSEDAFKKELDLIRYQLDIAGELTGAKRLEELIELTEDQAQFGDEHDHFVNGLWTIEPCG